MKIKELRQKSNDELKKLLADARGKLSELNFKVASNQLKQVREVRKTKKMIARILTLLNYESINSLRKLQK